MVVYYRDIFVYIEQWRGKAMFTLW